MKTCHLQNNVNIGNNVNMLFTISIFKNIILICYRFKYTYIHKYMHDNISDNNLQKHILSIMLTIQI